MVKIEVVLTEKLKNTTVEEIAGKEVMRVDANGLDALMLKATLISQRTGIPLNELSLLDIIQFDETIDA